MKKTKAFILVILSIIVITILSLFCFYFYSKSINFKGVENSRICDSIKPGISIDELIRILGKPINTIEVNGETWVTFQANPFAAGVIRARIDKNENRVIALKCWEDKKPNWDINTK
jgi:hypothetical protein